MNKTFARSGISGMKGNEGHWGGEISIISQNFSKCTSILFHPLNPPFPKQGLTEYTLLQKWDISN
jgi:hypothetical protein